MEIPSEHEEVASLVSAAEVMEPILGDTPRVRDAIALDLAEPHPSAGAEVRA